MVFLSQLQNNFYVNEAYFGVTFWFPSGGKSWETPGLDRLMPEVGAGKVGAGKCQASSVLSPLTAHLLPVSLESWAGISVRCLLGFPFLVLGPEAAFLRISFWSVLFSHIQFKTLGRKKSNPGNSRLVVPQFLRSLAS